MKYKLIGIAGPAQCGKDTAADRIIAELPYVKISFADPLKRMLKVGLELTSDQVYGDQKQEMDRRYGCTPRHMMQTLGTEWGRNMIDPDIWVKATAARVKSLDRAIIIPDVRIIGRQPNDDNHESEAGVKYKKGDISVYNTDRLQNYLDLVDEVISTELLE